MILLLFLEESSNGKAEGNLSATKTNKATSKDPGILPRVLPLAEDEGEQKLTAIFHKIQDRETSRLPSTFVQVPEN